MKRINVTLYDEVFEDLDSRTKEKKCGSIAQSIRELIDLGRKLEKAANENNSRNNESNELYFIIETLKKLMRCTLESLLISRQIMMKLQDENTDESEMLLNKCKEQAAHHTKKLFDDTGEIIN